MSVGSFSVTGQKMTILSGVLSLLQLLNSAVTVQKQHIEGGCAHRGVLLCFNKALLTTVCEAWTLAHSLCPPGRGWGGRWRWGDPGRLEEGGGPVGRQPHCACPFKESSG